MKRGIITFLTGILCFLIFSGSGYADSGRFAVAGKLSTLGAGVEITTRITSDVNLRLGANTFSHDYSGEVNDVDYDLDLDLLSGLILLDWHPFHGGFRLSGGGVINRNEIDMTSNPTVTYTIGNKSYTFSDVGTLTGKVDFDKIAPYAGIGWGNAVGKDKRWGLALDMGVVFQGSPDIDLVANGLLASVPSFQEDLAREKKDIEDKLDRYEYYPVIAFGITYKF
jgi:hypothetical protein